MPPSPDPAKAPAPHLQAEDYERTAMTIWRLKRKKQQAHMLTEEAHDLYKQRKEAEDKIDKELDEACNPPAALPMEGLWAGNGQPPRPAPEKPARQPELKMEEWTQTKLAKVPGMDFRAARLLDERVSVNTVWDAMQFFPGIPRAKAFQEKAGLSPANAEKAAAAIGRFIEEHGAGAQEMVPAI